MAVKNLTKIPINLTKCRLQSFSSTSKFSLLQSKSLNYEFPGLLYAGSSFRTISSPCYNSSHAVNLSLHSRTLTSTPNFHKEDKQGNGDYTWSNLNSGSQLIALLFSIGIGYKLRSVYIDRFNKLDKEGLLIKTINAAEAFDDLQSSKISLRKKFNFLAEIIEELSNSVVTLKTNTCV